MGSHWVPLGVCVSVDRLIKQISVRLEFLPRPDWLVGMRLPIILLLAIVAWIIVLAIGGGIYLLIRQFL